MQIKYKNTQLKTVCEDAEKATKAYGNRMAEKLHQRIDEIIAADSVEVLVQYNVGRCHALKGNLKGQYAMDLVHPQRLVFTKIDEQTIAVQILGIIDYH